VPTSALVFGPEGTFVWVVEEDHARKQKVVVGRDFGTELEVTSGLSAESRVITNPGERLVDGSAVRVSKPAAPPRTAAQPAANAPDRPGAAR
jgi:hypothetical protein